MKRNVNRNRKNDDKREYVIALVILFLLLIIGIIIGDILIVKHAPYVEMWIGLYGALIGGFLTLVGVLVTVNRQRMQFNEEKRLQAMPLLGFDCSNKYSRLNVLVSLANSNPVFELKVAGYFIDGEESEVPESFNSVPCRLVGDEKQLYIERFEDDSAIESLRIRFQYKDLYGNQYAQDLILKNQSMDGRPYFIKDTLPAPELIGE